MDRSEHVRPRVPTDDRTAGLAIRSRGPRPGSATVARWRARRLGRRTYWSQWSSSAIARSHGRRGRVLALAIGRVGVALHPGLTATDGAHYRGRRPRAVPQ